MRSLRSLALLLATALLAAVALAGVTDARGWQKGTKAANAARVLSGPEGPARPIALPPALLPHLGERTLLVYFAPTCPHCQHAQPEFNALSKRLEGKITVLGIATGSTTEGAAAAYRVAYEVPYPVLVDADRRIGAAMGARSTPSALLVRKRGKEVVIEDGWYPYQPGQDTLIAMRALPDPWAAFAPGVYVGNSACAACHVQETEAWLLSFHSVAWRTLVQRGVHEDPACNVCHVTGAGQPTGWSESRAHLVDVGCEACHGPGGPHDGERTEPATTCEGCHDAKHSIAFSYAKGLPLIDHYKAVGLDEAGWRTARRALVDGELPRDLLAFPDGKHVGAAACAPCHAAEHAAWAASPHATAMRTLSTEAARAHVPEPETTVACVSCHATADASGPPPTALTSYRVDEGVGCESCHGPGEAHVAAGGGRDNIVHLGENCPVCVLEAVCTRCHDGTWDPGWVLEPRVDAIRHGGQP